MGFFFSSIYTYCIADVAAALIDLTPREREKGGGGGPWAVRFAARRSPRIDNCPDKSWAEEILSRSFGPILLLHHAVHTFIL